MPIIFLIVKHLVKLTVQNKYYKQHIFITMRACERVTEIWKPWGYIYAKEKERRVLEGGNLPKNLLLDDNKHGQHSGVQAFLSGLFPQVAWGHRPNGSAC